jgi:hypothetical protein
MAAHFFYSDTDPNDMGFRGLGKTFDPHKLYLKHLENWFFLKHTYAKGTLPEQFQATIELPICERKLKYWSDKASFNFRQVENRQRELSTIWEIDPKTAVGNYTDQQRKWLKAKGIKLYE